MTPPRSASSAALSISTASRPRRRATRVASQTPAAIAVASTTPYQRRETGPTWTRTAPGERNTLLGPAEGGGIEEIVGQVGVDGDVPDRDASEEPPVEEDFPPERIEEVAHEAPVVGQREVDDSLARGQLLAPDEPNHTVFGIEPDRGARAITRAGADDGDDPTTGALVVDDVVADAERTPHPPEVGGRMPKRREQVRAGALGLDGRRLVDPAVGPAHPHPPVEQNADHAPPLEGLFDSLSTRNLHEEPPLARRLFAAPVRVVEGEALGHGHIGQPHGRQARHERLDRGSSVDGGGGRGGEREQQERDRWNHNLLIRRQTTRSQ